MPGNTTKKVKGNPSEHALFPCKKATAGTINKGQVVCYAGYDTGDDVVLVELAKANSLTTMPSIGFADDTITDSDEGNVVPRGLLKGINTSSYSVRDELYVSADTAGAITTTRPPAPNYPEKVGVIAKDDATDGWIDVYNGGIAILAGPLTTKGDLIVRNATDDDRLPVGTNGYYLKANSAQDLGVEWAAGGASDADAIHDNVSAEISAISEKATPVSADLLIIEDSAASNAKKKVQIGNLPSGSSIAIAQMREVGGGDTLTGSYADLTFDTADVETGDSVVDIDLTNNEIDIKSDGVYRIEYNVTVDVGNNSTAQFRAVKNGSTLINGSETGQLGDTPCGGGVEHGKQVHVSCYASLVNTDTVRLQGSRPTGSTTTTALVGRTLIVTGPY
jgi:hypothetical protein